MKTTLRRVTPVVALAALLAPAGTSAASASAASTSPRAIGRSASPLDAAWHSAAAGRTAHRVTVYVANAGSGTVTPIRAATGKAGKAMNVGLGPGVIAITPDGKTAYVANTGFGMGNGDAVTPFETATDRVGAPIEGLSGPIGIVITPDGKTAYVADSGSGTVTPIRVASNTAGKVIRVGSDPVYIAIAG